jgi:eukaryotic-like serine/threonine-protein kinase
MEFRILGPLEVLSNGRPLDLGGLKQRALLSLLLLDANRVVSRDRLIDALWDEHPTATADKALQGLVSQLREILGRERVETEAPGYRVRVEPDELDLARFRRLRTEAKLREALALWRGPALAGLNHLQFAHVESARLEEMRLSCLEERIDRDLDRGDHAELVGELEALVAAHPLRERLRAQLMLCLYRCGRQAEALGAYQAARNALVDELGIEPSRALRDLHQAVLEQDRALDVAAPAEPAASRGVFVGRRAELGELVTALDGAIAGRGRLVLLAGEPGIGKSRLAEALSAHALTRGARVLVGRCWEAGGAPAYWPWVQALRTYVEGCDAATLRSQLGRGAPEVAQIVPELRELLPDVPEPPSVESEGARFRLFEAVRSVLLSAAQDRPVVLVLDDLHAADEPSLLLLRFVVREIAASRLLVIGAYRTVDPVPRDPLSSAVAELAREPQTDHLVLAGLSEREVEQYIELSPGVEPAERVVRAIHTETEGNPLFVTEVVRLLGDVGAIIEADTPLRIPAGVRAVIGQRVGRLSEPCRNLLITASVLGREFGLDVVGRLSRLERDELLDVLDEAMTERLVGEVPGSPGRLRFGHALIRDTLYDQLTPARRMQRHQHAAETLEALYTADQEPHLAELAHHFFASAPAGNADKAVEYTRRAAQRAASQLAYEEAVRLYELAMQVVQDPLPRCNLLLALGDAQARAGDTPGAKQSLRRAAELAAELQMPDELARAALGYGGRIMWEISRDDQHLLPLLERALAALGDHDGPLRARVLARLAGGPLRDASFPPDRKASLSQQALDMARRIGDQATLAYALDGYVVAQESPDNTQRLLDLSTELLDVAFQLGDKERMLEAHEHRHGRLLELGQLPRAGAELDAMATLAQELRQPAQDWLVAVCAARLALLEGRFADAERLTTDARRMGQTAQSWNAEVTYRLQVYVLRREQGRVDEVEELVRRSVEEYPTYPIWRCVLAHMAAELGHVAESREALASLATDEFAEVPFDAVWLASISLLAETASSINDSKQAPVLYDLLLPYAARVAVSYPEIAIGPVAYYLGALAVTLGRGDAERHFKTALQMSEQIGAGPWLAHTQRQHARMLLARDDAGDRDRAIGLLADATRTYLDLGMNSWAKFVEQTPAPGAPDDS